MVEAEKEAVITAKHLKYLTQQELDVLLSHVVCTGELLSAQHQSFQRIPRTDLL